MLPGGLIRQPGRCRNLETIPVNIAGHRNRAIAKFNHVSKVTAAKHGPAESEK